MNEMASAGLSLEQFRQRLGTTLGVSPWYPIDQSMIDRFAEITGDGYFIHTDPARAAVEGPYGGTIAHGMLVLSLLSDMATKALPVLDDMTTAVNYGFNRIRFAAAVPSGSRVRAHFVLADVQARSREQILMRYEAAIEVEDSGRKAVMIDWLCLVFRKPV